MKRTITVLVTVLFLFMLILDGGTALQGAKDAIAMCLQVVIPSLFPFIFATSVLVGSSASQKIHSRKWLCQLFRSPDGTQDLLLAGIIGGYPVGARGIGQAVAHGALTREQGGKMLAYCNVSGPAFIFGISAHLFSERWIPWVVWIVQLCSAIFIANISPVKGTQGPISRQHSGQPIPSILRQSMRSMADICGWIVLVGIVASIIKRRFLHLLPAAVQILVIGLLEISNGSTLLNQLQPSGLRFILFCLFVNFGGICVALQTHSVAPQVDHRSYIPGKAVQGMISALLSYFIQLILFPPHEIITISIASLLCYFAVFAILVCLFQKSQKSCGNSVLVGV